MKVIQKLSVIQSTEITNLKYQFFGTVKFRSKSTTDKKLDNLQSEKLACDDPEKNSIIESGISTQLEKKRKEILEKQIINLKNVKNKKGKTAAIFQLKDSVVGSKKVEQEATVIMDPITKCEVDSVEDIKRVSLNYCKELLTNRSPNFGFEDTVELKNEIHELRMNELIPENECELSIAMFDGALRRLSLKNPKKYEFILKGGKSLIDALFYLFQKVWSSENIPAGWKKSSIVQLYKGKGSTVDLNNYRNIHTKEDIRKVFGEIVTYEVKNIIPERLSKFQIGAMAGHRPQEHQKHYSIS